MVVSLVKPPNAALVLADGTVFSGYGIGHEGTTAGEICFNTAMTGYQEVLTDPSYCGQIITFTFPHIGNVGCNEEDIESAAPVIAGLVLREEITEPSNFRATAHLDTWLKKHKLSGITGIDTRALTRHIREKGAQNAAITYGVQSSEFRVQLEGARKALATVPDMAGLELAKKVSTKKSYSWAQNKWELGKGHTELRTLNSELYHVVAIDYGVKQNILRCLASAGCRITVVPAQTSAEEVLALQPDGIFLSNGPGDPAATGAYAVPVIRELVASGIPVFGICLGHQMLGLALGAQTEKMKQGHRGANHPVKDLRTGKVAITSQNHGFAISDASLPNDIEITHRSLFDGTIQGIAMKNAPVFSVQGHPEASPGPHDWGYLFAQFVALMKEFRVRSSEFRKANV